MGAPFALKKNKISRSVLVFTISVLFIFNSIFPTLSLAQQIYPVNVINQGATAFHSANLLGMTVHPENPLLFDFIVSKGDSKAEGAALDQEALKMVKYFMASLTVPDEEMWVNLSPNEPKRITSEGLGLTTMGKDLLSQDYILKQVTSSMLDPENKFGKEFWQKIYKIAYERFGTTDIPVNTFNKVWIVPSKAAVYENGNSVFVVTRELKVMLEKDYVAMKNSKDGNADKATTTSDPKDISGLSSQIIREVILPELEKEVNNGKYFANLRQVYNAMILAKWYKETLRESLLGKVYVDKNRTEGIDNNDPKVKEKIYQDYLEAFRKGVFNFIKDEYDPVNQEIISRKYFSGGLVGLQDVPLERFTDFAMLNSYQINTLLGGQGKGVLRQYTIKADEIGPDHDVDQLTTAELQQEGVYRKFAVDFQPGFAKDQFDMFKKKENFMGIVSEEVMIRALASMGIAQGAGGLGFLIGEENEVLKTLVKSGALTMTFAYKHYKDLKTGEWVEIDWKKRQNVHPLMTRNEDGTASQLRFHVSFKGAYNGNPLGTDYWANTYYINNNGNLILLFDIEVPEGQTLFHHLYDSINGDEKRWIQFGLEARTLVEFYKAIGAAPDVLHINEGHMAFVYPAIRNDIEFHRKAGTRSIFEGIKLIFTNHTPVYAGIPQTDDIEMLRRRAGDDLVKDYMLTDGKFNSLYAMVQNTSLFVDPKDTGVELVVNGVSKEHWLVILNVLLKNFPGSEKYQDLFKNVITYIQNGSRMENWISPRLAAAIEKNGLDGITGAMLLDIADKDKMDVNKNLVGLYGDAAPQFNEELLKTRPIIGFLRRWVEYKEAGVLIPLLKWITGDKDKMYSHPVLPNLEVLNNEDWLEEFLKNPQWEEGPGLETLVLAGGKKQGEEKGEGWLEAYKSLSKEPGLKGRLVVVEDTGFPIMQLATWASTFWYNVPDLTLEASGTSQQRVGFLGKLIVAIKGAGMSAQIKHKISGFLLNPFPKKSQKELMEDFNPMNGERLSASRIEFRKRIKVLSSVYIKSLSDMYYNNRTKLEEMMLRSFRYTVDTVNTDRMAKEYGLLGISLSNEKGIKGFEAARREMYLEDLFVKIYRWHPVLKGEGVNLGQMRELVKEVWTPLDDIVLGEDTLNELMSRSDDGFKQFLYGKGFNSGDTGLWRPVEGELQSTYLRVLDKAQITAEGVDAGKVRHVGGIDLNPKLLDLQIKRDNNGVPLPLPQQPLRDMKIEGFLPVIINVTPIPNVSAFLGKGTMDGPF